jgi:HK97 family phage major capsid protein
MTGQAFTRTAFTAPTDEQIAATVEGDGPPIIVTAVALPWNQTVPLDLFGDTVAFDRGSVDISARSVPFLRDHVREGSHLMGGVVGWQDRPDGLHAAAAIPRDELADVETARAFRQMRSGIRDGVSVFVEWDDANATRTPIPGAARFAEHHQVHSGARVVELSSVILPRFDGARVTDIAAAALDTPTEPDPTDPEDPDTGDDPMTDTATTADALDLEAARLVAHRQTLAATVTGRTPAMPAPAPRFATFGDLALAITQGSVSFEDRARVGRALSAALVDETTADIGGIVPPQWLTRVVQLVQATTPTVQAFAQIPLPAAGMQITLPVTTVLPTVGLVATEKGAIPSGKTTITPTSYGVKTYAGGEDISIAALARSDPSYLELLMNYYAVQMSIQLEHDVAAAVVAAAPVGPVWPATQIDLADPIIKASAAFLGALGRPAEVVVMSVDVWQEFGLVKDTTGRYLFPNLGPMNAAGTFDAVTTAGTVRGLSYYVSNQMPAATAVVGVRDSFVTMLGAMGVLGPVDNVANAGRDVGVYEFAAFGATDTRGLAKITGTLPTPSEADNAGSGRRAAAK